VQPSKKLFLVILSILRNKEQEKNYFGGGGFSGGIQTLKITIDKATQPKTIMMWKYCM
jgi:hypothetical protein